MPSKAKKKFKKVMLPEVTKLVESHQSLSGKTLGRRNLHHITSSGVVMLFASWELYVEELASEIADHLLQRAEIPDSLPKRVRQQIVKALDDDKNELVALKLAGEGWKEVYTKHLKNKIDYFNSPKSKNIDELYSTLLGWENPSEIWGVNANKIDKFVKLRHAITHGGLGKKYSEFGEKEVSYVTIIELNKKITLICNAVDTLDNAANDYITKTLRLEKKRKKPWYRNLKL